QWAGAGRPRIPICRGCCARSRWRIRALRDHQAAVATDPGGLDIADERRLDGLTKGTTVGKKVTIIGGGSSSFVPVLLRRLMTNEVLGDSTVTLMDIDQGRLDTMQRLGEKLIEGEGSALRVESTTDQRRALEGADFVIA